MTEWFADDTFWSDIFPFEFGEAAFTSGETRTRIKNEWLYITGDRVHAYRFHLRVYSGQELKTLVAGLGFRDVKLFGALDGRPYGADVERLIVVARKEAR